MTACQTPTYVTWNEVGKSVRAVNAELADIIDDISPGDLPLIKVSYPFGADIVDRGQLMLPNGRSLVPATETVFAEDLNYCPIPLGALLNRASEVYLDLQNYVAPLNFLSPGQLFGVFEVLNMFVNQFQLAFWSVASGAKSIFMLPKITRMDSHQRLSREFSVSRHPPQSLPEQHAIFAGIAAATGKAANWFSEVVLFTDAWMQAAKTKVGWQQLRRYLSDVGWQQTSYARDQLMFGLLWQTFSRVLNESRLKPRAYLADTVKYLVRIPIGTVPAFRPAAGDEQAAPFGLLQKAYVDVYGLQKYLPTMMCLSMNDVADSQALYYSLAYPIMLDNVPVDDERQVIISDLREVRMLVTVLIDAIAEFQGRSRMREEFQHIIDTNYQYYSADKDVYGNINLSKEIVSDHRFLYEQATYPEREFCASSQFLRGCVQAQL